MTIKKADFSLAEQSLIQTWIDTEIPARISAYQDSVAAITAGQVTLQEIEDIFETIYADWADIHTNGFLDEIWGLKGDYVNPPVDEAEIQSTATNPVSTRLFPGSNISLDPLYAFDLRASGGDFNATNPAWSGTEGTGSFVVSNSNEWAALVREQTEWGLPSPPQDDVIIRDMWLAQEAAIQTQLNALSLLDSRLEAGQGGKSGIPGAVASTSSALTAVQGYLTAYPAMPVEATRLTEINTRKAYITARVNQILLDGVDGQEFVRDERYYWATARLNLGFGSLSRLKSSQRSITSLNDRIAALQAELVKYADMGF